MEPSVSLRLPEHLKSEARIQWVLTHWCNYTCDYCGTPVFLQRDTGRDPQAHAFDHAPPKEWLAAFDRFPQRKLYLKIGGGEPFLDHKNFRLLLEGLVERSERIETRIFTNGSWNPRPYHGLRTSSINLMVALHPVQTAFEPFLENLRRIRDAGFCILTVNFVLAPENLDSAERVIQKLDSEGFTLHVISMQRAGRYIDRWRRTQEEITLVKRYCAPIDAYYHIVDPPSKNRPCFHPALSYELDPRGSIYVACIGKPVNVFHDPIPFLPAQAVACPLTHCIGCTDMYRSLADEPLADGLRFLMSAGDYLSEINAHRRPRGRGKGKLATSVRRLLGLTAPVDRVMTLLDESTTWKRSPVASPQVIPLNEIKAAIPEQPLFGYIDRLNGANALEASGRQRISLSGWAASSRNGAPVKEVQLVFNRLVLQVVRDFYPRPEVVQLFGRNNLLESGWRTMVYLPMVPRGEYSLLARAVDHDGTHCDLDPFVVRIVR